MKSARSLKIFAAARRVVVLGLAASLCVPLTVFSQEDVQASLDDVAIGEAAPERQDVLPAEVKDLPGPVVSVEPKMPAASVALRGKDVIGLDQTLKNIIEQNSALRKEKDELEGEVKLLRGQRTIEENRFDAMRNEMLRIQQQADEIVTVSQRYSRQVVDLQAAIKAKESEYQLKLKELQEGVPGGMDAQQFASSSSAGAPARAPAGGRKRSVEVDVVSMMEQFSRESENLKRDTAKVHYNMGNIFFRKGEYKKAVREYRKVLELVPADPAAHFNLAFVSGEYLSDPVTALKHYREYLLLSPDAPDAGVVQGKILESNLAVRMLIDSPLDRIPKVK